MLPAYRPNLSFADIFGGVTERSGSVEVLEETFQAKLGYPHAVYFPGVQSALRSFFECLAARQTDVVHSPYNPLAIGMAIKAAGRHPLYIDTGGDFNPDPIQFRAAMASSTTACGIANSLWGTDFDDNAYRGLDKPVLYDFTSRVLARDQVVLKSTDAVLYSLNWDQPLTTIRGAVLCASSRAQAIQWREWRERRVKVESNWRSWMEAATVYLAPNWTGNTSDYYPGSWAYALGVRHIADRERLRGERRAQISRYQLALKRLGGRLLLPIGESLSHYPVRVSERDVLGDYLKERGVSTSRGFGDRLLCDYPDLAGKKWREPQNARRLMRDTLLLPLFVGLTEGEQKSVATHITRWADAPALPGQSIPCYLPSR